MTGADPKRRVLYITTPSTPPLGADTWVHIELMRAIDRDQHDVHVACVTHRDGAPTPAFAAVSTLDDVTVVPVDFGKESVGSNWRDRLRAIWRTRHLAASLVRLARYVRRERIDLIHTTDRPRDAVASVLLARITRTPCVIHVHVVFRSWIGRPLRWSLGRADARIGVSQFVANSLVDAGYEPASTFAVLNAVDIDRWEPDAGRADARSEFGVKSNGVMVLCACRLFPEKGVADLISAIAALEQCSDQRVVLVLAGLDPSPDGGHLLALRTLVEDLGLSDAVIFAGQRSDIDRLMAAADIYAMPSFEEPFGLVYAEAMAMKVPVVALDNGGTAEVVSNGIDGLLSPPGDHVQLVDDLRRLIDDPELRAKMGRHGRRTVETRFSTERMAADVAEIYALLTQSATVA